MSCLASIKQNIKTDTLLNLSCGPFHKAVLKKLTLQFKIDLV